MLAAIVAMAISASGITNGHCILFHQFKCNVIGTQITLKANNAMRNTTILFGLEIDAAMTIARIGSKVSERYCIVSSRLTRLRFPDFITPELGSK